MEADGSSPKQLTAAPDYDHGPSFSPNGSKLVFAREISSKPRGHPEELFTISTDGTALTRLTNNNQSNWEASFSPSGDAIVYSVDSEDIWLMNADGSKPRRLGKGSSPAFSPDGKKIVFVSGEYGQEISIMNSDGSTPKSVYQSSNYMSYPTFSPDGGHILFLEEREARGTGSIKLLRLSDRSVKQVADTR
jgi:TolB protein